MAIYLSQRYKRTEGNSSQSLSEKFPSRIVSPNNPGNFTQDFVFSIRSIQIFDTGNSLLPKS